MDAKDVISRMKQALKVSKDIELARQLEVGQQNVSNWQKRGTVPYAEAIRVAEMTGVSLEFLFGIKEPQFNPLDYETESSVYNVAYFLAKDDVGDDMDPKEFAEFFVDLFRHSITRKKSDNQDADLANIVNFRRLQKSRNR